LTAIASKMLVRSYGYKRLTINCMYTVRVNDIVDNAVKIPIRMIQELGCTDG